MRKVLPGRGAHETYARSAGTDPTKGPSHQTLAVTHLLRCLTPGGSRGAGSPTGVGKAGHTFRRVSDTGFERTIVAMGGLPWQDAERRRLLEDYVFGLAGKERPRVLFVPTAAADDAEQTLWAYSQLGDRAQVSHVSFFPWPPDNLRQLALDQDVIFVSGGNTANALA